LLCLFAVIAAPILARLLDFIPPYRQEIDKPVFNVLIVALVIAGTLAVFPPLSRDNLETLIAKEYPVAIQGYLKEHPLRGGVLNLYLWGGYLIWHNRDAKVFIDGRADIFEYTGVMKEYGDLVHLQTVDPTIEKYGVRYVLFSPDHPLTYVLTHDPRWKEQYRDDVSVLLERVK
jgi:hypothetical protein